MTKHAHLNAIELINLYGIDKVKAELKRTSAAMLVERIDSMQDRSSLIPGRDSDDQQLRAMAMVREELREHLYSLKDTGRLRGELPDDLPAPNEYSNLFTWLMALRDAIKSQCPDSDMFRNVYRVPGFDYPEWRKHLGSIHADIPALLSALASNSGRSDFGRAQHLDPTYYSGYQDIGQEAYALLFAPAAPAIKGLEALTDKLKGIYPAHSDRDAALELLSHSLLSEKATAKLLASGWDQSVVDLLSAHSGMQNYTGHSLINAVISVNLERLYNALRQSELEARQRIEADKLAVAQAEALNARKAVARRRMELQGKLVDDSISAEELQELEELE
ncbi:hypothetical protein [Escherichia coli]|uniref:hypothetical protein n=1 Tax=Escherichia coli TaxID=562 RepID=UPI0029C4F17E|nr:hypothetical protein [Escherichia coli]MDX5672371.1 hypothetical protein [Escherichia coli]